VRQVKDVQGRFDYRTKGKGGKVLRQQDRTGKGKEKTVSISALRA